MMGMFWCSRFLIENHYGEIYNWQAADGSIEIILPLDAQSHKIMERSKRWSSRSYVKGSASNAKIAIIIYQMSNGTKWVKVKAQRARIAFVDGRTRSC